MWENNIFIGLKRDSKDMLCEMDFSLILFQNMIICSWSRFTKSFGQYVDSPKLSHSSKDSNNRLEVQSCIYSSLWTHFQLCIISHHKGIFCSFELYASTTEICCKMGMKVSYCSQTCFMGLIAHAHTPLCNLVLQIFAPRCISGMLYPSLNSLGWCKHWSTLCALWWLERMSSS